MSDWAGFAEAAGVWVTGIVGSIFVYKQNRLIQKQNSLFGTQNKLVAEQNSIFRKQTELMENQRELNNILIEAELEKRREAALTEFVRAITEGGPLDPSINYNRQYDSLMALGLTPQRIRLHIERYGALSGQYAIDQLSEWVEAQNAQPAVETVEQV